MFENNIKIRLIVKQNGNNFLISNSTRCLDVLCCFFLEKLLTKLVRGTMFIFKYCMERRFAKRESYSPI